MIDARPAARRGLAYEARLTVWALLGGAPALVVALWFVWRHLHLPGVQLALTVLLLAVWLLAALVLRDRVIRPLQTLSNLIAALQERDYSIRARGGRSDSPLGLAFLEVNLLADTLRRQRLDAIEATALLRQVMESIDVAVFAFDPERRLRLLNPGAERLIDLTEARALGRTAEEIGLGQAFEGETPRLVELAFPGRARRWELRRGAYRWEGRPHVLVVLSDLTRSLREEEQLAWQRLVRVLSHEINNSLAPIKSIAGSLRGRLAAEPLTAAGDSALEEGLEVIESRAEALVRFIHEYARLTRLPRPRHARVEVGEWVKRVAALETRRPVIIEGGPPMVVRADPDQLDALLINLVRNAADAALETDGGVRVRWTGNDRALILQVEDDGPGLSDTSNLFVPFFTTKAGGTGIGLALCRQIAQAHGGSITLENRSGARGCVALFRLPTGAPRHLRGD
jgi:nitrogen fixation/metabolism regulation signal transduction histidine kinase